MPDDSNFPTVRRLLHLFDLVYDVLGKVQSKQPRLPLGIIAQIAIFTSQVTSVSGLNYKGHVSVTYSSPAPKKPCFML